VAAHIPSTRPTFHLRTRHKRITPSSRDLRRTTVLASSQTEAAFATNTAFVLIPAFPIMAGVSDYIQLTHGELKRLASDRKVKGRGALGRRQALIDALIEDDKVPPGQINYEKLNVYTLRALAGERGIPGRTANRNKQRLVDILRADDQYVATALPRTQAYTLRTSVSRRNTRRQQSISATDTDTHTHSGSDALHSPVRQPYADTVEDYASATFLICGSLITLQRIDFATHPSLPDVEAHEQRLLGYFRAKPTQEATLHNSRSKCSKRVALKELLLYGKPEDLEGQIYCIHLETTAVDDGETSEPWMDSLLELVGVEDAKARDLRKRHVQERKDFWSAVETDGGAQAHDIMPASADKADRLLRHVLQDNTSREEDGDAVQKLLNPHQSNVSLQASPAGPARVRENEVHITGLYSSATFGQRPISAVALEKEEWELRWNNIFQKGGQVMEIQDVEKFGVVDTIEPNKDQPSVERRGHVEWNPRRSYSLPSVPGDDRYTQAPNDDRESEDEYTPPDAIVLGEYLPPINIKGRDLVVKSAQTTSSKVVPRETYFRLGILQRHAGITSTSPPGAPGTTDLGQHRILCESMIIGHVKNDKFGTNKVEVFDFGDLYIGDATGADNRDFDLRDIIWSEGPYAELQSISDDITLAPRLMAIVQKEVDRASAPHAQDKSGLPFLPSYRDGEYNLTMNLNRLTDWPFRGIQIAIRCVNCLDVVADPDLPANLRFPEDIIICFPKEPQSMNEIRREIYRKINQVHRGHTNANSGVLFAAHNREKWMLELWILPQRLMRVEDHEDRCMYRYSEQAGGLKTFLDQERVQTGDGRLFGEARFIQT